MAPGQDEGGAWISAGEIYMRLERISEAVIRLEARLSSDDSAKEIESLEGRVSALERLVWRAAGGATAVGAILGYVVDYVSNH